MKKIPACTLVLLFCIFATACNATKENTENTGSNVESFACDSTQDCQINDIFPESTALLPGSLPQEFTFSSGAGAWWTFILLDRDGSFEGVFRDSEMGETGDDYPNGSAYLCEFTGQFDDIKQVNDDTYTMTLGEINPAKTEGEEWIEDGIRYIASEPYGFESGTEFLFYTPETPLEGLSEDFLMWWPNRSFEGVQPLDTLSCYGICNVETQYGFFTYE